MPVLVTVHLPHPLERVQEVEAANPDLIANILAAAVRHQISHQRYANDDGVLDITYFADKAAYDAFIGEAGDAMRRCGELLGAPTVDTLWFPTPSRP